MWYFKRRFKQHLKQLLQEQDGQGLVEFALVLPILLLLTLGTILLTLSYIQKARMNGLAFMSARVAIVRRANTDAPNYTLQQYKKQSGQNWVDEVKSQQELTADKMAKIRLQKPGERLDVLANLISGQNTQQPMDLVVQMQLPIETSTSGELRHATYKEINYQYEERGLGGLLSGAMPDILLIDDSQMADAMSGSIDTQDQILSLNPPNASLKKFYEKRKWSDALSSHDEKPAGDFEGMQTVYNNFKTIENTGLITGVLLDVFAAYAKPLGSLAEAGASAALTASDGLSKGVDANVRSSFGGGL